MSNNLESIKSDLDTLLAKLKVVEAAADQTDNLYMAKVYRAQAGLHEARANVLELIQNFKKDALNMEEIPFPG